MPGQDAANALIAAIRNSIHVPEILPRFRDFLQAASNVFSAEYSPRVLVRPVADKVPKHPRHVADVRARMGTLIEAGLAGIWNEFIKTGDFQGWRLAVNYVTEYPDLYLRDDDGERRLRIEVKTLHDEADEGAARFDTLTPLIDASTDVLVVVGWRWQTQSGRRIDIVYPVILAADAISAHEIARERDVRFEITGGVFKSGGRPYVRAKKGASRYVPDPSNYGKLNRIIHRTRRDADLTEDLQRFAELLLKIYPAGRAGGLRK